MERMSTVRTLSLAAAGLVALVALAGPATAGGGGGAACAGFAEGDEVVLRDACLDGTAHFADEADDLTVVNEGVTPHDYTAVDGSFGTGSLAPGASTTVDVPAGVHRVRCTLHSGADGQGMAGVLVVGDPSADVLAAASTASDDAAAWWRPSGTWTSGLTAGAVGIGVLGLLVRSRRRTPAW